MERWRVLLLSFGLLASTGGVAQLPRKGKPAGVVVRACLDKLAQPGEPADRAEVLARLVRKLADRDWDGDGCPDFGDSHPERACGAVDPLVRGRLYAASGTQPAFDDLPAWVDDLPGPERTRTLAALAAREAVRAQVLALPEAATILAAVADEWDRQQDDDAAVAAFLTLREAVARAPMDRRAPHWQSRAMELQEQWAVHAPQRIQIERETRLIDREERRRGQTVPPDWIRGRVPFPSLPEVSQEARLRYLQAYGPDSAWARHWAGHPDMLAAGLRDWRDHQRDLARLLLSKQAFVDAANAYEEWLRYAPEGAEAREVRHIRAHVLFAAGEACGGAPPPDPKACDRLRAALSAFGTLRDAQGNVTHDIAVTQVRDRLRGVAKAPATPAAEQESRGELAKTIARHYSPVQRCMAWALRQGRGEREAWPLVTFTVGRDGWITAVTVAGVSSELAGCVAEQTLVMDGIPAPSTPQTFRQRYVD